MSLTSIPEWTMVNILGDLFYPDSAEDALEFASGHGAWPVLPLRFPWAAELANALTVEFCGP